MIKNNKMKKAIYLILFISTSLTTYANKDKDTPVSLGDPFIMLYENTYYAYGTNAQDSIHPRAMYISDVSFSDDAIPVMGISEDILRPELAR